MRWLDRALRAIGKQVNRRRMWNVLCEDEPSGMQGHLFHRAKRIDYDTAVQAEVSKQNFSVFPRCWYIDTVFGCEQCGDDFTFTAQEQRFWYEDLHFWIDSLPTKCQRCRRQLRQLKMHRRLYDAHIEQALRRDADRELKSRVVAAMDELEAAGVQLAEKMLTNRATLRQQLRTS